MEGFIGHLPPLFQREVADIREWQKIDQRLQGWFLQFLTRMLAEMEAPQEVPLGYG